ncbi:transposase [Paraphaeosphaeria sporulosa]
MLHQNARQSARISELEEQLDVMTKRKSRKRKQLQKGGTLEYGETADQVAAEPSSTAQQSKKARGQGGQDRAPATQRRCGTCGGAGHNTRTCRQVEEVASESEASTQYIFSDSSGEDIDPK